jgi:hypothetical protein
MEVGRFYNIAVDDSDMAYSCAAEVGCCRTAETTCAY